MCGDTGPPSQCSCLSIREDVGLKEISSKSVRLLEDIVVMFSVVFCFYFKTPSRGVTPKRWARP